MIGVYLRVSTDKQDEAMQWTAIQRLIGIVEHKKYVDFGLSGTTTERPGYQQLLADITAGQIETIYVYEYSRLWRDLQEQSRVLKMFSSLGIKLISVREGEIASIEDEFKANILGSANVFEAKRTKQRIMDGIARKKKDIAEGKDVWNGRGKDKKARKRYIEHNISLPDRFWDKIDKKNDDECWLWIAYKDKHGFGQFSYEGKPQYPHILVYESQNGKIPDDRYITHVCNNHSCCNPKHLKIETIEERFWRRTNIKSDVDCWEWTNSKDEKGYGLFSIGRKTFRAHRIAYELKNGKIPKGMLVCHTCDNPSCVNPNHLFIGTNLDNCKDKILKERAMYVCGELQGHSKITDLQVEEIRKMRVDGIKLKDIAEKFGITETTVSDITNYKSRKRVTNYYPKKS